MIEREIGGLRESENGQSWYGVDSLYLASDSAHRDITIVYCLSAAFTKSPGVM